jgi:3-oxoacyl-[acyl-carrier protein] reductase
MSILLTDLRSHLALVTGASGGIGNATCLALASMGCSIAVHYHSSADKATALVEELKEKGVRAEAFKADLTKYDEVQVSKYPAITPHFQLTIPLNLAALLLW